MKISCVWLRVMKPIVPLFTDVVPPLFAQPVRTLTRTVPLMTAKAARRFLSLSISYSPLSAVTTRDYLLLLEAVKRRRHVDEHPSGRSGSICGKSCELRGCLLERDDRINERHESSALFNRVSCRSIEVHP